MARFFISFLLLSLLFFPLVSSCGAHDDELESNTQNGGNVVSFGFFGGMILSLGIIAIVLGTTILIKKSKNERRK